MSNTNNEKASLGCGTLILIALIVMIFGNMEKNSEVLSEIRQLRKEVQELRESLAATPPLGLTNTVPTAPQQD